MEIEFEEHSFCSIMKSDNDTINAVISLVIFHQKNVDYSPSIAYGATCKGHENTKI